LTIRAHPAVQPVYLDKNIDAQGAERGQGKPALRKASRGLGAM